MKDKHGNTLLIGDVVKIPGDSGLWTVMTHPDDFGGVDVMNNNSCTTLDRMPHSLELVIGVD